MKRFDTLRMRFALSLSVFLLIVLSVFGLFIYESLKRELSSALNDSLRSSASQVLTWSEVVDGELVNTDPIPEHSAPNLTRHGLTVRVLNTTGEVLQASGPYRMFTSDPAWIREAAAGHDNFDTVTDPATHEEVRFYTVPVRDTGTRHIVGVIQLAQDLHESNEALQKVLAALLISAPVLVLVAGGAGYMLAARALAPIDHITQMARRISAKDLRARLHLPPTEDEVGRLAETFDAMLGRLESSFMRERQFTADASHELRTPLAAMQVILNVTRAEPRSVPEYEQALDDLADEASRLRGLVEDLLHLARNDAQHEAIREEIDLAVLLSDVTDSLRPLADAKHLNLSYSAPSHLPLEGDSDGMIRLFVNLIDNAVKYTDHGGISVRADVLPDTFHVSVCDTGAGIDAEHIPRLFDRFYRVETSRTTRGSGLGLAIAHDIARAHGGKIEVQSHIGKGTTFTVLLPRETVGSRQPAVGSL